MKRSGVQGIDAIVPLKITTRSKARLSHFLSPNERAELTLAMLQHVLSTLRRVPHVHSVTIVSADESARRIAKRFGANYLWEGKSRGLNSALRLAIGKAVKKGRSAILVVHADLPLLTIADVTKLLEKSRGYPVTLAPSKDGSGTNALLVRPSLALPPSFGKDSFRRHLLRAQRRRLRCKVVRSRGFGFDVDEPNDLLELMRYHQPNATGSFLRRAKNHNWRLTPETEGFTVPLRSR